LNGKQIAPFVVMATLAHAMAQQQLAPVKTGSVTVTAVDGFGALLSKVKVTAFVDEEGHDRTVLFQGSTARGVPFGKYLVTVQADNSRPSTFYADVVAPQVLLTAGLEW
jgi:hypothetical protein